MRLAILLTVVFLVSGNLLAESKLTSRFGVILYLPDNWRLLTPDELNAVDEADTTSKPQLENHEPLAQKVRGSELELIFNKDKVNDDHYDNITLLETQDQVPEAAAKIKSTCTALPSLLSRTLGRHVTLDICERKSVQGYPAFVLSYAGDIADTHILQYMLQLEQNRSLVLTLTHHDQNPAAVADFEAALQRLEFN